MQNLDDMPIKAYEGGVTKLPDDMSVFYTSETKDRIAVERARDDMRRGVPVVVVCSNDKQLIVASSEEATLAAVKSWQIDWGTNVPVVALSPTRSQFLFQQEKAIVLPIDALSSEDELARLISADVGQKGSYPFTPATPEQEVAANLAHLAELLPSVIVAECQKPIPDYIQRVTEAQILAYSQNTSYALTRAVEAPLTLKEAEKASIIAYRPSVGGREHYAILIGDPLSSKEPLVRVHSSCYTGDLLGSLACDCGDQLHSAIALMWQRYLDGQHGGIILYLMQEGRGIGLTNKLRTYEVQSHGHDTVDANRILGFKDDERLFEPAAKILNDLGITSIRLLTNNPRKAKELERIGIKVVACDPHIMPTNEHNEAYLKTKAERLGHKI